jgi:hypothetical protein
VQETETPVRTESTVTPDRTAVPTTESALETRLQLRSAVVDETVLETGQSMEVTATLRNTGRRAATFRPTLAVDGQVVDTRPLSIEANETETLAFEHRFEDAGLYTITVASTRVGNLTVVGPDSQAAENLTADRSPPEGTPIAVVDPRLPTDWVQRGYNATVLVGVSNPWNQTVTSELTVTVDGEQVRTRIVELVPNETRSVRIEFPATAGVVAVDGIEAGRLDVSQSLEAEDPSPTRTEASGPGFGLELAILVVGALLSAAALVRGRDESE